MVRFSQSRMMMSAALIGLVVLGGCKRVPGHQGFISDPTLISSIKAGVDNRESVVKTLGRPSFEGQFDKQDWYYVARDTRTYAFRLPVPYAQQVTHVRFDKDGNVIAVDQAGIETVALIRPEKDKTPTLGRNRTLFEDIFGNIGQVGAVGKAAGTSDNPTGGQ